MYVENNLVFYNTKFDSQNELFDFIADALEKQDYVKKEFREAIKKREKQFPTGLKLPQMNVAIVHTEVVYSKVEKLVILKLEEPLEFRNIETLEPLDVELIIGLVLNNSQQHLKLLQKVSQLLQNEELIKAIQCTASQKELSVLMQDYFNREGE